MADTNRRGFLKSTAVAAAGVSMVGASSLRTAAAEERPQGTLPTPFPRTMGPNTEKYLLHVAAGGRGGDGREIRKGGGWKPDYEEHLL